MIPADLLDRIETALARSAAGQPVRNVPWRVTDADIVLADLRSWRAGQPMRHAAGPMEPVLEIAS